MRRLITISVLFVLTLAPAASAESKKGKLLKRLTGVAACGASMLDVASTAYSVNRGGVESNGLLSNNGRPAYGKMVGIKIGACVGNLFLQEKLAPEANTAHTIKNLAITGVFSYAALHNFNVGQKMAARVRPGTPAPAAK